MTTSRLPHSLDASLALASLEGTITLSVEDVNHTYFSRCQMPVNDALTISGCRDSLEEETRQ